jgi:hypothetical protein
VVVVVVAMSRLAKRCARAECGECGAVRCGAVLLKQTRWRKSKLQRERFTLVVVLSFVRRRRRRRRRRGSSQRKEGLVVGFVHS